MVTAGIGLIGDLREGWAEDWGGIRTTVEEGSADLGRKFDEIVGKVDDLWGDMTGLFEDGEGNLIESWEEFWGEGFETAFETMNNIADAIDSALDGITDLVNIWSDTTLTGWDGFWAKMGETVRMFFNFLDGQFNLNLPSWFTGFMDTVSGFGGNMAGGAVPLGYSNSYGRMATAGATYDNRATNFNVTVNGATDPIATGAAVTDAIQRTQRRRGY
jgi:hypothetical protein